MQPDSPEAVESSRRDVGEVERGRSGPPSDHPEMGERPPAPSLEPLRNRQGQHRLGQGILPADPDPPAVELGAPPPGRGEELVAARVVDHRVLQACVPPHADGDRVVGDLTQVVGGSVERIDDPGDLLPARPGAAFLPQEPVAGVELAHGGDDRPLRGAVHFGGEVAPALAGHFEIADPGVVAQDDVAGPACGPDRDVDDGMHEATVGWDRRAFYRPPARPPRGSGAPAPAPSPG